MLKQSNDCITKTLIEEFRLFNRAVLQKKIELRYSSKWAVRQYYLFLRKYILQRGILLTQETH